MRPESSFTKVPHVYHHGINGGTAALARTGVGAPYRSTSAAGAYIRTAQGIQYVQAPEIEKVSESAGQERVDVPTALAYIALLFCMIGFVLGITYPRSAVGILFPLGLTLLAGVAFFSAPRRPRS